MPAPVLVILLLGDEPENATLARAAEKAMQSNVAIRMERREGRLDRATLDVERSLRVGAVAHVEWRSDKDAVVSLHMASTDEWREKPFSFRPEDPASDRNVALGYGLATMIYALPEREQSLKPRAFYDETWWIGAAFRLGAYPSETPLAWGVNVSARYFLGSMWRLDAGADWTTLSRADVTMNAVATRVGVACRVLKLPVVVDVRLGVGPQYLRGAAGNATDERVVPNMEAAGEVSWRPTWWFSVFAAPGVRTTLGKTDVRVDRANIMTLNAVSGFFDLGAGVGF